MNHKLVNTYISKTIINHQLFKHGGRYIVVVEMIRVKKSKKERRLHHKLYYLLTLLFECMYF